MLEIIYNRLISINKHKYKVFELFSSDIVSLVVLRINRNRGFGRTAGGVRSAVILLYTMHSDTAVNVDEQKKPHMIMYYNKY